MHTSPAISQLTPALALISHRATKKQSINQSEKHRHKANKNMYNIWRLTSASGCYSDFTDKGIAEKELANLVNNGKSGSIETFTHYLPSELKAMANSRREYGKHPASDYALMVLLLMETESHANNYCAALREVLAAFPEVDRDELETELDRYI